jgi:hypothetical protein
MKIVICALVALLVTSTFAKNTKNTKKTGPKKAKYYKSFKKIHKSPKAFQGKKKVMNVPVAIPAPAPNPDAGSQGSQVYSRNGFEYYALVGPAGNQQLHAMGQNMVAAMVAGGYINPDGTVSAQGQSLGITAKPVGSTTTPSSSQTVAQAQVPTQNPPSAPASYDQRIFDYSMKTSSGTRTAGRTTYQMWVSNGYINVDGTVSDAGKSAGVTAYPKGGGTPVVQAPIVAPVPVAVAAPTIHTQSTPTMTRPDLQTPVPTGMVPVYYFKTLSGAVSQLDRGIIDALKSNGHIRPDGSLTSSAIQLGITRTLIKAPSVVSSSVPQATQPKVPGMTPPKPLNSGKNNNQDPLMNVTKDHFILSRAPETKFIYFAPKAPELEAHEREVLDEDEISKLAKENYFHPDGSLTAKAVKEGYHGTVIVEEDHELPKDANDLKSHIDAQSEKHDKIKQEVAESFKKAFASSNNNQNSQKPSQGNFYWIFIVIALIFGGYIFKNKVAKNEK